MPSSAASASKPQTNTLRETSAPPSGRNAGGWNFFYRSFLMVKAIKKSTAPLNFRAPFIIYSVIKNGQERRIERKRVKFV